MKKLLSTLAIFICGAVLVGCSSSKSDAQSNVNDSTNTSSSAGNTVSADPTTIQEGTEKVVYSAQNAEGLTVRYTLYYKDGKVTNETVDTIRPYSYFQVEDVNAAKALAEEEVAEVKEEYSQINGFSYVVTTEGENVIDTMHINYADGDVSQLITIPGVCLVDDTSNGISIDEFEKALVEGEYTKEA